MTMTWMPFLRRPSRKKSPGQAKPQRPNDEDLPEALPEPAPSKAKAKPKPRPQPANPDDDEVPRLDPPQSS